MGGAGSAIRYSGGLYFTFVSLDIYIVNKANNQ